MRKQVKRLSINEMKAKIQKNTKVTKATAGAFGREGEIFKIHIPGTGN